ncbi:MAG: hypothetical protein ACO30I_00570 [Candidatus Nanopelagicales bacterium]
MMEKLGGWDLLTWRLGYEDKGIVPLVGAQLTLDGHIDFEDLVIVLSAAVEEQEILSVSLTNEKFPHPIILPEFDLRKCIEVLHHQVNPAQFALRHAIAQFSPIQHREDLPLWRVYVVYQQHQTLLFTFLHHAIADGRKALEVIFGLSGVKPPIQGASKDKSTSNLGSLFQEMMTDPMSLLQIATPALLGLNSLLALSPKHTLPYFADRSFRNNVFQYSIPRNIVQAKAKELNVSSHDISVALGLEIIKNLEEEMNISERNPIRVNIPVSLEQAHTFNQILISRLFIPRLTFAETAQTYRTLFKNWREHPSVKMYQSALSAISQVELIDVTSFATHSDLTLSSLPYFSELLSIGKNEVLAIWPLVPTMGSALNITSIGYNNVQYVTLTCDIGTKIDGGFLRRAIRLSHEKNLGIVPNFEHQL